MTSPYVQGLVESPFLAQLDGIKTDRCSNGSDHDRSQRGHKARRRCNGNETHNRTSNDPKDTRFVVPPTQKHPYHCGCRCGGVRSNNCIDSQSVCRQSTASIESKPSHP